MVLIGLLSWSATALQYSKGRNALFHPQMGIRYQSNGLRVEMNVGTGKWSVYDIIWLFICAKGLWCLLTQ